MSSSDDDDCGMSGAFGLLDDISDDEDEVVSSGPSLFQQEVAAADATRAADAKALATKMRVQLYHISSPPQLLACSRRVVSSCQL